MHPKELIKLEILKVMESLQSQGTSQISSSQLLTVIQTSSATLKRNLEELVASGQLIRSGKARATRYQLATDQPKPIIATAPLTGPEGGISFPMTPQSQDLLAKLNLPLASRTPVTYQRS